MALNPKEGRWTRRSLLAAASLAPTFLGPSWLAPIEARAMGRIPIDGTLKFRLPWRLSRIDPHDLHDPVAAIFGSAIADSAYARDERGRVYPALADGMPFVAEGQTVVKLRPGLRTASGNSIGGRDLAWSVKRARLSGAAALFAGVTKGVKSDPKEPLVVRFGEIDPERLALLLSSPLTAVLPVAFSPTNPDATGALKASPSASQLTLERNPNAARGPSYLERIEVQAATDLADSLRSFESGRDDLGWLGLGFHRDRRGASRFGYGAAGWVVLVTGKKAGSLSSPGRAQQLANHVPVERLHVGLRGVGGGAGTPWSGPPTALYYARDPQLREIAEAIAPKLGEPGSEVTPKPVSRATLRRLRASGAFALCLDFVRSLDIPHSDALALATADARPRGVELGKKKHWPRGAESQLTRTLRIGVLGSLPIMGGAAPGVKLAPQRQGPGIAWGASYRLPR